MADLLKQMWFLMTIEMYKLWHKGTEADKRQSVNLIKTLMSELGWIWSI